MGKKYYIYIPCKKCKGTGRVIDHMMGSCGFGIGYLAQKIVPELKQICNECDGSGQIKRRVYHE